MTYERDGWTYPKFERPGALHVLQRAVPCPACGAPVGAYCKSRNGRPTVGNDPHFARQRAAAGEAIQTDADRFWAKVEKTDTCWLWTAGTNGCGYGRFWFDGRFVYAHRWAYEQVHDTIASGLVLDHLCRNPSCVRPDHLEAVTESTNVLRGGASFNLTGLCIAGLHQISGASDVYVRPNGVRQCLRCIRTRRAEHYQRTRSA